MSKQKTNDKINFEDLINDKSNYQDFDFDSKILKKLYNIPFQKNKTKQLTFWEKILKLLSDNINISYFSVQRYVFRYLVVLIFTGSALLYTYNLGKIEINNYENNITTKDIGSSTVKISNYSIPHTENENNIEVEEEGKLLSKNNTKQSFTKKTRSKSIEYDTKDCKIEQEVLKLGGNLEKSKEHLVKDESENNEEIYLKTSKILEDSDLPTKKHRIRTFLDKIKSIFQELTTK